jgi:hypothetical protein
MRDAVKIAREAGRFDGIDYNVVSLAIENERQSPGYKPPTESPCHTIRRVTDALNDVVDRRKTEYVLSQIKKHYLGESK